VSHNRFSGSFVSFVPKYFNGLYLEIGAPGNFPFHGMHLWYLLFLFLYSLLCYGLFRWLKSSGAPLLDRVTKVMAVPGLIYLWLVLPLVIIKILVPQSMLSVGQGGWGFVYYIWFLVAGFIMASSEELRQCLKNQRLTSLVLGGVFMLAYLFQVFSRSRLTFPEPVSDWILALLNYLSAWCLLAAILGFGLRYLAFDSPWVRRANEGVLPFYIMHQSVLVIIGFWVVTWNIPDLLKWIIIFGLSFLILVSLYWFCIGKYDLLRFVFGMKTNSPVYARLSGRWALAGFHVLYLGLFSFGLITQILGPTANLKAMPLQFDSQKDVVLNCESITRQSGSGVRVVQDAAASAGRSMEFSAGATQRIEPEPEVFVDLMFEAPAGTYVLWLRGKAASEDILTDSVRLQWDHYLGTSKGISSLGNWNDLHPAGSYAWASNGAYPSSMVLRHNGRHRIRLQPRQTPHRIDQIWLSRFQWAVPETAEPLGRTENHCRGSGEQAPGKEEKKQENYRLIGEGESYE
jgi:hypothetical protein